MTATPFVNALYRQLEERHALCHLPLETKGAVFTHLLKRFPDVDWFSFVDALNVIEDVRRAAYELADQARDSGRPSSAVAGDLAYRFPDLDRDVIEHAVGNGFFESR